MGILGTEIIVAGSEKEPAGLPIKTALTMGEARGAALAAIAEAGLEIYELAPRKVKQAIVGYGAAQKLAAKAA